jgi:hypothetical protein
MESQSAKKNEKYKDEFERVKSTLNCWFCQKLGSFKIVDENPVKFECKGCATRIVGMELFLRSKYASSEEWREANPTANYPIKRPMRSKSFSAPSGVSSSANSLQEEDPLQRIKRLEAEISKLKQENLDLKNRLKIPTQTTSKSKVITSQSSKNASSPPAQTETYASVARKRIPVEDIIKKKGFEGAHIKEAEEALKRITKPNPKRGESSEELSRIYVRGPRKGKLGELRKSLMTLRFRVSEILNISFVATNIMETLVSKGYESEFKKQAESFNWEIITKYDPSNPMDVSATEETKNIVKEAFIRRTHHVINTTTKPAVRNFYITWLSGRNIPLPRAPSSASLNHQVPTELSVEHQA